MADKCKEEKKALEKAQRALDKEEGLMGDSEEKAEALEAAAQRELGSIGECIEGGVWSPPAGGGMRWYTEGELDEKCVIDKWISAYEVLDAARAWRVVAEQHRGMLTQMREDEKLAKDVYCDCLNREGPR